MCRVSLQDLLNQRNLCSQKTQMQRVLTCSRLKKKHIWPILSKFDFFMFLIWLTSCANDVQVQSSFVCKSPGAALKLAAMKRMRDAGWTTVSSSDKKKKKVTDKIFAWNCLHQKCDFILFKKTKKCAYDCFWLITISTGVWISRNIYIIYS